MSTENSYGKDGGDAIRENDKKFDGEKASQYTYPAKRPERGILTEDHDKLRNFKMKGD